MKPPKLYKTTVVIWSDRDPRLRRRWELSDLAREAESGDAYCSGQTTEEVTDSSLFPETEFFDTPEE